ncbi:MAG TPA: response regulator transcription factor [Candidatus Butyricicoccus avistercoris]|uniref:Stage 0 sporulation protein A homolog n=1 Tax=Candidatus Butyricicoccus avistercoris TaxID=2838518 RepID=A0A9D1TII4_9FIRM|nr:response regulator transcription factor [Candidatus Butyricicoccus avistercoris]
MNKILLLEDDITLGNGIKMVLKESQVILVHTLEDARKTLKNNEFDLLILDINLPDGSGLDLMKEQKNLSDDTPIILLTANDMEIDIVSGLELGADDYITKPFSLAIFRARVNNQLRRKKPNINKVFQIDDYYFDFDNMIYRKNQKIVELSKTEQKLLRLLVENRGHTLTRELLVDKIWGSEYVDENALTVTVKRLRGKIEDNEYLKTVYVIGYTWAVK